MMNNQNSIPHKIWALFDILRGESLRSGEFGVLLYFMSLYRDKVVEFHEANHFMKDIIDHHIGNSKNVREGQYRDIHKFFRDSIQHIRQEAVYEIFSFFHTNKVEIFNEDFASNFDEVLYTISDSKGKYSDESLLPQEVSRLMIGLADVKGKTRVFNPFAGLASFSVLLDSSQSYSGEEINGRTWALGMLRLFAYERDDVANYIAEDSLRGGMPMENMCDYIISAPPFNLMVNKFPRGYQKDVRTVEQFLIENGLSSLSETGKLIMLIPMGFLFRSSKPEKNLREYIVNSGVLEMIVSLPAGLLSNTNIPSAILILNKAKNSREVTFIDASRHISSKIGRKNILDVDRLLKDINESSDLEFSRNATDTQIKKNDFNLSVNRYFIKDYPGIKLSEVLEPFQGQRSQDYSEVKLVRIRDLKSDILDYTLIPSEIPTVETKQPTREIEESCILLATRWKALKPTYFEYTGEPLYISHDMLSLRVKKGKEKEVSIPYLIHELGSDQVNAQVNTLRSGVVPIIRKIDLMQIKIVLPSIEEQLAKVQGLQEISSKIAQLKEERNNLAHGITKDSSNEYASLKHTLGRPRQNIIDWTDNLLDFLKRRKESIQDLSDQFAVDYDLDMLEAIEEIKKDVNFMSEVLEKGENGLVLDKYSLELTPLSDINKLVKDISSNTYKFKIKKMSLSGKKLAERGISCNKVLMNTLIENVLTNANKHGFTQKTKASEVVIELTDNENLLKLEIRNNGKSFPKNFDREKFITKFKTGNHDKGTGLGGYDINRISAYLGDANWELVLNDPIFPVKYIFRFPIKLAK